MPRDPSTRSQRSTVFALFAALVALYLWTAPGRILFPDDEIVFQTTEAIYGRASLEIPGIGKRTGELEHRPDGTFGWAEGRGGRRYGFFGHGLSLVALPLYAVGRSIAPSAPEAWRHALRSDHYYLHPRSPQADWPRLLASLTNALVTPFAAWLLLRWLVALGFAWRIATLCAIVYATGTLAWPYSRTMLSEPLSAAVLLGCAWAITEVHSARDLRRARNSALVAGVLAGFAAHVHVLNLVALPCLLGYGLVGLRGVDRRRGRGLLLWAVLPCLLLLAALLYGQWWRFGDPFETGRYDHYSHWIAPGSGALALLLGPGRSFFLYSPALVVAAFGWRLAFRRIPTAAWLAIALIASRWMFVAMRSDWWGGWSIGPRYLVPVIPFALLPLATLLADARTHRRVIALAVALTACATIELHLALHSIFEWMLRLTSTGTPGWSYLQRSHWVPAASPLLGFFSLPIDTLSAGAFRLAAVGHAGLAAIFAGIAAAFVGAAGFVAAGLARSRPPPNQP